MGCAASSDIDRAQSKHDLNSTSGIVTPCWWNAGANAILHADASDEKPTPAEEAQLAKLAEQWSIHSRGDIAEEPSRLLLAVREKKMIVMARLQNGIDDDPDQFVPFPEPERDVQASIARSRAWCDDVLAAMKRCEDSFVRSSSDHPLSNKASESFLLPGQTVCSQHEHATGVTLPMPTIFTTPALRSGDVAVSASNKADKAAPSSPGSKYLGGSGHDPYLALAMSSLSDAPTSTKGLHFGAGRGDSTPASGLNYARLLAKTGAGEATPIDRGVNCCPTPDDSPASSSYTLMQRSLTQENLVEHMMLIRAAHRRVTGTPRSYTGVDPAGGSSRNLTKIPPSPQLGPFPRR